MDLAIVGAGGIVGEALLETLQARDFPVQNLYLLDSGDAVGERLPFRERQLPVKSADQFDFGQARIVLYAGDPSQAHLAERAADAGCVVIGVGDSLVDEAHALVVAEVNPEALSGVLGGGIVTTPSASVAALAAVLKPIDDAAGVARIDIVSLRAVSAYGKAGIEQLASQTAKLLNAMPVENGLFSKQIAFNVLAHTGDREPDGESSEEVRLIREMHRLFGPGLGVNPTVVTVPVFFGHCEAVHLETRDPIEPEAAAYLLRQHAVEVFDETADDYPTPVTDAARSDAIFVARLRRDPAREQGLNLWLVADNVRRGMAGNAIRIAEILARDYL